MMADADARLLEHDRVKTATFRFRSRVQDTDVLKTSGPGLCEMPQEAVLAILSNVVQLSPTSREELDTLSAFFSVNRFFAWHFLSTADSTKVGVVQRFMVQAMLHRYSNDLVYSVRLFSNQPKTRRTNASSRGRKPVTYSSFPSSSSSSSLPSSSSSSSSSSAAAVSAINDETDAFLGAVDAGTYQDARCRAEDELQLLAPGLFKKVQPAGEVVASGKSSINMDCRSVFFATLRWLEKLNGVHRKPSPTLCWGVASPQDAAGGGGAGGTSFSYSKSYLVCHTSLNELAAAAASICRATDTAGSEFNDGLLTLRVIVVGPKGTGAVSGAGAGDGGGGAAAVPGVDVWPFDQWVRYRSRTSAAPVLALAIHSSAALLFAASDLAPSTCAQNVLLGITPALAQNVSAKRFALVRSWTKSHFSPHGYYVLFRSFCDTLFPVRTGSIANAANFYGSVDDDFYGRMIAREFVALDDYRHELVARSRVLVASEFESAGDFARRNPGFPDCSFLVMYVTACVSFDHVHFWNKRERGQSSCASPVGVPSLKEEFVPAVSTGQQGKVAGGACCGCCCCTLITVTIFLRIVAEPIMTTARTNELGKS